MGQVEGPAIQQLCTQLGKHTPTHTHTLSDQTLPTNPPGEGQKGDCGCGEVRRAVFQGPKSCLNVRVGSDSRPHKSRGALKDSALGQWKELSLHPLSLFESLREERRGAGEGPMAAGPSQYSHPLLLSRLGCVLPH